MIGQLFQRRMVSSMLTRNTLLLPLIAVCAFTGFGGDLSAAESKPLPAGWDAKAEADKVLGRLINVTKPQVKGAHDAEFVIVGDKAYIVAEANDEKPGEAAAWPFVYVTLTVVDVPTMKVKAQHDFARGGQVFGNVTLPVGACFVPRILKLNEGTLRLYFASEEPGKRQSVTWYLDYEVKTGKFANELHKTKIKTAAGTFDMEPQYFHADAVTAGFTRKPVDFGLYIFDSFKWIDGQWHVTLNNYPGGQNALGRLNAAGDTFEVLGHYNQPAELKLTESSANRLPDGSWLAICRQEGGNGNYTFSTSPDGRKWNVNEYRPLVPNGSSSKPTLDKFGEVYYLGWQESTRINNVSRSVFNVEVSKDGKGWERKYRFETEKSFQYPAFHDDGAGKIYVTVTQGDSDASRKERIMFGRLE